MRTLTGNRSGPLPRNSSLKAVNAFSLNRGQVAITFVPVPVLPFLISTVHAVR